MKFKRAIVWLLIKTGVGEWVWRQIDEVKKKETADLMRDIFGYDPEEERNNVIWGLGISDAEAKSRHC